jgi:hypothetical protein
MSDPGPDQIDESDMPSQLALDRHRDWVGRGRYVWVKRAITAVLVLFIAAALLNVFGQRTSASAVHAGQASMSFTTPHRLRLGLVFETHVTVTAHTAIAHPTLVLSWGWFSGTTLNSTEPAAASEASAGDGGVAFSYPRLAAGRTMDIYFQWSVNPTAPAWQRPQQIRLLDGARPILADTIHVTVFP